MTIDGGRGSRSAQAALGGRRTFTLTASEARFAALLVDGRSIAEICDHLANRTSTARTHLRHLFQKTDTRRQAELVSALLRGGD